MRQHRWVWERAWCVGVWRRQQVHLVVGVGAEHDAASQAERLAVCAPLSGWLVHAQHVAIPPPPPPMPVPMCCTHGRPFSSSSSSRGYCCCAPPMTLAPQAAALAVAGTALAMRAVA